MKKQTSKGFSEIRLNKQTSDQDALRQKQQIEFKKLENKKF